MRRRTIKSKMTCIHQNENTEVLVNIIYINHIYILSHFYVTFYV